MKLSVMQPYLFPYLGYYQLAMHSDIFVLYDDVTYIKNGYINRNKLILNGKPTWFTIPVKGASSNILISELSFSNTKKIIKSIQQNYSRAPYFDSVFPLVKKVLEFSDNDSSIISVCNNSISSVFEYLNIEKDIIISSDLSYERSGTATQKLISMSNLLSCDEYINSIGGQSLYSKEEFSQEDIVLSFLKMNKIYYLRDAKEIEANLSILDILMWCSKEQTKDLLNKYELL